MPKEKVRLISPFIGGGFGGKLFLRADAVLAALGARAAGPAGEGGTAPAPDVQQHDPSAGHDPAHPDRRDRGRQDHRDRARKLVRQLAGRQARRRRSSRRACSTREQTA